MRAVLCPARAGGPAPGGICGSAARKHKDTHAAMISAGVAGLALTAVICGCSVPATPTTAPWPYRIAAIVAVSEAPSWLAANPATDTIYVAGGIGNVPKSGIIGVISGRTNTVQA